MRRSHTLVLLALFAFGATQALCQQRPLKLSKAEYEDRVHAAWLGQIIGTLAGFQFEGKPASSPLVRVSDFPEPYTNAPVDDDYYYEFIALLGFEKFGIGMTLDQLGELWKEYAVGTYGSSAETRINLARGIPGSQAGHPRYNRLWWTIGPQFSSDTYGMIAPGDPNLAGRLARKFGHLNGYAEGTDGAVFVAGMVSLAFRETDPKTIVRQAARLLHPASPYRQSVDMVITMAESGAPAEKIFRAVEERWRPVYDRVNNAVANGGIVAGSVWFGEGDFLQTINLAFSATDFSDADCNAASAGAVAGAMKGTKALPAALVRQLQDRLAGNKMGRFDLEIPVDETISGIARRVSAVGLKMLAAHGARMSAGGISVPSRRIETQPAELFDPAEYTQFWNPEWKLERASRSRTYLDGDVLVIVPAAETSGAALRRQVQLGANSALDIEVAAEKGRAWQLEVVVNNTRHFNRRIEGGTQSDPQWVKLEVDLSAFRGQNADVRILQRGPGAAYWRRIGLRQVQLQ